MASQLTSNRRLLAVRHRPASAIHDPRPWDKTGKRPHRVCHDGQWYNRVWNCVKSCVIKLRMNLRSRIALCVGTYDVRHLNKAAPCTCYLTAVGIPHISRRFFKYFRRRRNGRKRRYAFDSSVYNISFSIVRHPRICHLPFRNAPFLLQYLQDILVARHRCVCWWCSRWHTHVGDMMSKGADSSEKHITCAHFLKITSPVCCVSYVDFKLCRWMLDQLLRGSPVLFPQRIPWPTAIR